MDTAPITVLDLTVASDHGQTYIYSPVVVDRADGGFDDPFLDSLDDAADSGRMIGAACGLIDLLTPGQWNTSMPMRLEIWPAEPPDTAAAWDHEVDLDLDVEDGTLTFEASGGGGARHDVPVPSGRYRARLAGRGYRELGLAGADGDDSYRLQLWPRSVDSEPVLRKRWPGWDDYC
jgi:hypothetical protein